jgi:MoxR-like ATPase
MAVEAGAARGASAELTRQVQEHSGLVQSIVRSVEQVVVGQRYMVERLLIGLLTGGHVLLEGVPGLAKTLTVSTLARTIEAKFSRIQFTPDLLPADLVGTLIYNPRDGTFFAAQGAGVREHRAGRRDQPRAGEGAERAAGGDAGAARDHRGHDLPDGAALPGARDAEPDRAGGHVPLPEAQVDRFMLKLGVGYPTRDEERSIVDRMATSKPNLSVQAIISPAQVEQARRLVDQVYLDAKIRDYIVDVVHASREPEKVGLDLRRLIEFGASPRASIALAMAARAHAFLQGRAYVMPSDVKAIGADVLRHRVILSYEALAENITTDQIVKRVFDQVPVP